MQSPKIQVFTENFISYIQFLETFGKCIGINSCPNGLDFTPKRSLCFQHNSAQCSKERTRVRFQPGVLGSQNHYKRHGIFPCFTETVTVRQKYVSWVLYRGLVIQANGRLTFQNDLRSGGLLCFIFNERQRPH